jgi:hypothetical protein
MEESRVRYSKLSMITATNRFNICGDPRGARGERRGKNIRTHPGGDRETRWGKGEKEMVVRGDTQLHKEARREGSIADGAERYRDSMRMMARDGVGWRSHPWGTPNPPTRPKADISLGVQWGRFCLCQGTLGSVCYCDRYLSCWC